MDSLPTESGDDAVAPDASDAVLAAMQDAIVVMANSGHILFWNPAASAMFGDDLSSSLDLSESNESRARNSITWITEDGQRLNRRENAPYGAPAIGPGRSTSEQRIRVRRDMIDGPALEFWCDALSQSISFPAAHGGDDDGDNAILTVFRRVDRQQRISLAREESMATLRSRLRRQNALASLGMSAATPDQLPATLRAMLDQCLIELPADAAAIVRASGDVISSAGIDDEDDGGSGNDHPPTHGPAAHILRSGAADWVMRRRQPLAVADPELNPFPIPPQDDSDRSFDAWAAVPLIAYDQCVGALFVFMHRPRDFQQHAIDFLRMLGERAAAGVVHSDLVAQLRERTDELRAHRDHLEELVAERTADLEDSHARLRVADRLAAVGTFTAGLLHDINNVLFPVRCRLDAVDTLRASLADSTEEGDSSERAGMLELIDATQHAVDFLQDLAGALRQFSRDPHSAVHPWVNLTTWWTQVGPMLKRATPRHVAFNVTIPDALPPVRIASHALTQAVLNLLVNAGEAIPEDADGTIDLNVARQTQGQQDVICMTVRDNGVGMPADVAAQIFDPFFSTKPRTVSTGLGCSLIHRVMSEAGGRVEVESEPGVGTCFSLFLPISDHIPADEQTPIQTIRVRLLGFDARRTAWVMRILGDAGITAETPPDGESADVLLVDADPNEARTIREGIERERAAVPSLHVISIGRPPPEVETLVDSETDDRDDLTSLPERLRNVVMRAGPDASSAMED